MQYGRRYYDDDVSTRYNKQLLSLQNHWVQNDTKSQQQLTLNFGTFLVWIHIVERRITFPHRSAYDFLGNFTIKHMAGRCRFIYSVFTQYPMRRTMCIMCTVRCLSISTKTGMLYTYNYYIFIYWFLDITVFSIFLYFFWPHD